MAHGVEAAYSVCAWLWAGAEVGERINHKGTTLSTGELPGCLDQPFKCNGDARDEVKLFLGGGKPSE
jgi:hypothetical protein